MSEQNAQDIAQMNDTGNEVPIVGVTKKKSGLLWVVLGCVVVGVTLGIVVYQQSLKPATKTTTSKTTSVSIAPKASPAASAVTPDVSVVNAVPNTVSFPKAGKIRVYYQNGSWTPVSFVVKDSSGGGDSFVIPAGAASTPMKVLDTGYELAGPATLTIQSYLGSNSAQLSVGWVTPQSNSCGFNGFGTFSVAPYATWATEQAKGEPLVSQQCWGDYSPNPKDTSAKDFNDYFVIFSYTPVGVSTSPSPSASVKASASLSPSASVTASISPSLSPSPSVKASTATTVSIAPSPSARAAMPDTSEGVPITGVFEVTVGTMGIGILLLILGLAGLLVL